MKNFTICLVFCAFLFMAYGCPSSNNPVTPAGFKGYIYFSSKGEILRIRLSDETVEKLFSNASQPDITEDGRIIAVEEYPIRIIVTDHSGVNRLSIIEKESTTGKEYKYWLNKPRISYNQSYIAYDGGRVVNPNTYVVNSNNGELVAIIGDYSSRQPMTSPSWAPDGSLFVEGLTSMNNGIYKVSSDFTSMERIDPNLSNVSEPTVSPDGSKIAFIRDGKIWTMGLDGSNATLLDSEISNFISPTWSPDSKYLAVVSSGFIHIVDFDELTITKLSKGYSSAGNQMCWRY